MSPKTKNGIMVGIAMACGLGLSARPWTLARAERATAARQIDQAETDEDRMVRDRAEEARLGTALGKEERLRSLGYRRSDELPLEP